MRAQIIIGLLTVSVGSGCSMLASSPESQPNSTIPAVSAVELYLSRSSFSDTEFEHFKLSGNKLFGECGKIRRGRQIPVDQALTPVSADDSTKITDIAREILTEANTKNLSLAKPGANRHMADPGQFTLTLSTGSDLKRIETSLDEVSNANFSDTKKLKKLTETLRGVGSNKLCGNKVFFGLGGVPITLSQP